MGRISDLIPALYYGKGNDLIRFTHILDEQVSEIETSIRGLTNLINVDRCPEDKLPYLAAFINCPLVGDDPTFWRKQIRNWPYILRLKGTQRSLELVLDSVGAASWNISTFFRDAGGGYVTEKPKGQPFVDANGLWRNIRTHYFGIELTLSKDFVIKNNYLWDVEEIEDKLKFWFERGKPYHAELLNLLIHPPKFLPDDHICRWDFCNWEHIFIKQYDWGDLTPSNPVFEFEPIMHSLIQRGIFTVNDMQRWDFGRWGYSPYRLQQVGRVFHRDFLTEFEEFIGTWLTPSHWDGFSWDEADSHKIYRPTFIAFGREFPVRFDLDLDFNAVLGALIDRDFIYDSRKYWDIHSWVDGNDQHVVGAGSNRDVPASLSFGNNPPYPIWSKFKTWGGSDTWANSTEQSATWEVGTWDFQEVS